jgi:hypothetical protein
MVEIRKATRSEIEAALQETNKLFEDNIIFKKFVAKGKNFTVTLTVKNSRKAGSRLGFTWSADQKARHISAACWHVYGTFFDNVIAQNKEAEIITTIGRGGSVKISARTGNNWQDANIGTMSRPMYYSEACECNEKGLF